MTNPYGGYGGPPNFQMPQFMGMPQYQQGQTPQAYGQGVQQWAQGLGNQFRGMMPQGGQGGFQPPNFQGMAQGYQNRLLGAGMGGRWMRPGGYGGPGQGGGGYGP